MSCIIQSSTNKAKKDTKMKLHHMTHTEIKEVKKTGHFADVFFFGEEVHYMMEGREHHYTIDTKEVEFVNVQNFANYQANNESKKIINQLANALDIDYEEAFEVLCENEQYNDDDYAYLQIIQAKYAVTIGFDGAISQDEQGDVYMIPMFGRESLLTKV